MSLLSFVGGIAQGMSEDIDRKRALADKKDLAAEQLENQIKAMTESSAIETRKWEAKRKIEKTERIAKNMATFTALGVPPDAAQSLSSSDNEDIKNILINYATNNPNTDWNTVLKIQEQTGDNVTDVMKPTYALDTSVIFKKEPKTFDDLSQRLDNTMDALVAAQIAGNGDEVDKLKNQISIIKNNMSSDTSIDLLDATRIASLRKTDIALSMGSYVQETASGEQKIQSILAGETFQFAEEFDRFQQAFKATTQPYLSNSANQQIVEAAYKSNQEILQGKLNTAMDRIEDIHFNPDSTQENKIVHQVNGEDLIVRQGENPTNLFKSIDANKNDIVKIMFIDDAGNQQRLRVLWGGSYASSIDSERNFKYVSSSFGNNPFTN